MVDLQVGDLADELLDATHDDGARRASVRGGRGRVPPRPQAVKLRQIRLHAFEPASAPAFSPRAKIVTTGLFERPIHWELTSLVT